jgi:hypothetical protein
MGVSGFGPAPGNLDEFHRRLREIQEAEAAQESFRRRKLAGAAITLAGIPLISAALVLKGGVPTLLKRPPDAPPASDIAGAQNRSGETAGTPANNSTMTPAGLSGATRVAPEGRRSGRRWRHGLPSVGGDYQSWTFSEGVRPAGRGADRFTWPFRFRALVYG